LAKSDRVRQAVRVRKALRRKSVYYALSTGTLIGGSLLLTFVNAPEWVLFAYLIGLWAVLMYVLRWRNR
jgi:hypothetical protein